MAKIIGLKPQEGTSKKTGNAYKAVIVHYYDEFNDFERKAGGIGFVCDNAFVSDDVFTAALEGRTMDEALDRNCSFYYNRGSSFVAEMVIDWGD